MSTAPPIVVLAPSVYGSSLGAALRLVQAAQKPLLTLDEVKAHLRIDVDDENVDLVALLGAATSGVETDTHLSLLTQTWEQAIDRFPCDGAPIPLLRNPVQAVSEITSYDADDAASVMSASAYFTNTYRRPGLVCLKSGNTWPTGLRSQMAGVIRFTSGFGDEPAAVDASLITAVKLRLLPLYERRAMTEDERRAYEHFIGPWVVHYVGD